MPARRGRTREGTAHSRFCVETRLRTVHSAHRKCRARVTARAKGRVSTHPTRLSFEGRQDGWRRRRQWQRARARFFAPLRFAQNDKIIVILRSAATKDLALARLPDGANTQGWRAESWPRSASLGPALQFTFSRPTRRQRPSRKSERSGRDGRAMRAPAGWQPFPFILQQQVGGSRFAGPRLYARSAS